MKQRLDKWLFIARLARTRALAQSSISQREVRVNRTLILKPGYAITPGDVITLARGGKVRVLRILGCDLRRADPAQAALLYEEIAEPYSEVEKEGA